LQLKKLGILRLRSRCGDAEFLLCLRAGANPHDSRFGGVDRKGVAALADARSRCLSELDRRSALFERFPTRCFALHSSTSLFHFFELFGNLHIDRVAGDDVAAIGFGIGRLYDFDDKNMLFADAVTVRLDPVAVHHLPPCYGSCTSYTMSAADRPARRMTGGCNATAPEIENRGVTGQ
jgi:hypothetical protein